MVWRGGWRVVEVGMRDRELQAFRMDEQTFRLDEMISQTDETIWRAS